MSDESWKDQWLRAEPGRRGVHEYFDDGEFTVQLMVDDEVVGEGEASTSDVALAIARRRTECALRNPGLAINTPADQA